MCDDSSRLIRGNQDPLVTGNPYQIRFRETAKELFPELREERLTTRATGELAIELPTAKLPKIKTTTKCKIDYVIFLDRRNFGPTYLSPFPKEMALRWFEQVIACWEPETVEAHKATLRRLLAAEMLELHYVHCASAAEELENLVGGERADSAVAVPME
jgi:hypothetical protein